MKGATIAESDERLSNLRTAAQDAINNGNFDEADQVLAAAAKLQRERNLGIALSGQGNRTPGEAGATLLDAAVTAYGAALKVRTQADHPLDWAMTQNNLATALCGQAGRTPGEAGAALLDSAVAAYGAALEVYTQADHPLDWAMIQNNLGLTFEQIADCRATLQEALDAFDAALTVFDPDTTYFEICSHSRDRVAAFLADRPT